MSNYIFSKNFLWGAAAAAYQIEGAFNEDGKGESIWDRFSHIPGKIHNNDTGDVACDHYHRYRDDVKLMKELGLQSYRLSVAWSRILPEGKGKVNPKGMDFYKNLVESLLENGIKPAVTLYHWDLPQKLQDIGGWANREVAEYFAEYACHVFKELGDAVPLWITLNEPYVSSFIGYSEGRHAPGITDFSTALLASHNLLLGHGKAVRAYRDLGMKGEIGITLNLNTMYPATEDEADRAAAKRYQSIHNRWFLDPVLKGSYPQDAVEWLADKVVLPEMSREDMKVISTPTDFLGVNHYFSNFTRFDPSVWPMQFSQVLTGRDMTQIGWEIVPEGFYDLLVHLHREYKGVKLMVTENGIACNDIVNREGSVEDYNRIDYLHRYLAQAHRAIQDGVNLTGYYLWSLMDNFEWGHGYSKRFGIVYVDYKTQARIIKKSGSWYRDVIKNNGIL